MFKLLSVLFTSLAMGSILASAAPQDYSPSESCITCPILFIPACSAICPSKKCYTIPRTCHKCEQIKCVPVD